MVFLQQNIPASDNIDEITYIFIFFFNMSYLNLPNNKQKENDIVDQKNFISKKNIGFAILVSFYCT